MYKLIVLQLMINVALCTLNSFQTFNGVSKIAVADNINRLFCVNEKSGISTCYFVNHSTKIKQYNTRSHFCPIFQNNYAHKLLKFRIPVLNVRSINVKDRYYPQKTTVGLVSINHQNNCDTLQISHTMHDLFSFVALIDQTIFEISVIKIGIDRYQNICYNHSIKSNSKSVHRHNRSSGSSFGRTPFFDMLIYFHPFDPFHTQPTLSFLHQFKAMTMKHIIYASSFSQAMLVLSHIYAHNSKCAPEMVLEIDSILSSGNITYMDKHILDKVCTSSLSDTKHINLEIKNMCILWSKHSAVPGSNHSRGDVWEEEARDIDQIQPTIYTLSKALYTERYAYSSSRYGKYEYRDETGSSRSNHCSRGDGMMDGVTYKEIDDAKQQQQSAIDIYRPVYMCNQNMNYWSIPYQYIPFESLIYSNTNFGDYKSPAHRYNNQTLHFCLSQNSLDIFRYTKIEDFHDNRTDNDGRDDYTGAQEYINGNAGGVHDAITQSLPLDYVMQHFFPSLDIWRDIRDMRVFHVVYQQKLFSNQFIARMIARMLSYATTNELVFLIFVPIEVLCENYNSSQCGDASKGYPSMLLLRQISKAWHDVLGDRMSKHVVIIPHDPFMSPFTRIGKLTLLSCLEGIIEFSHAILDSKCRVDEEGEDVNNMCDPFLGSISLSDISRLGIPILHYKESDSSNSDGILRRFFFEMDISLSYFDASLWIKAYDSSEKEFELRIQLKYDEPDKMIQAVVDETYCLSIKHQLSKYAFKKPLETYDCDSSNAFGCDRVLAEVKRELLSYMLMTATIPSSDVWIWNSLATPRPLGGFIMHSIDDIVQLLSPSDYFLKYQEDVMLTKTPFGWSRTYMKNEFKHDIDDTALQHSFYVLQIPTKYFHADSCDEDSLRQLSFHRSAYRNGFRFSSQMRRHGNSEPNRHFSVSLWNNEVAQYPFTEYIKEHKDLVISYCTTNYVEFSSEICLQIWKETLPIISMKVREGQMSFATILQLFTKDFERLDQSFIYTFVLRYISNYVPDIGNNLHLCNSEKNALQTLNFYLKYLLDSKQLHTSTAPKSLHHLITNDMSIKSNDSWILNETPINIGDDNISWVCKIYKGYKAVLFNENNRKWLPDIGAVLSVPNTVLYGEEIRDDFGIPSPYSNVKVIGVDYANSAIIGILSTHKYYADIVLNNTSTYYDNRENDNIFALLYSDSIPITIPTTIPYVFLDPGLVLSGNSMLYNLNFDAMSLYHYIISSNIQSSGVFGSIERVYERRWLFINHVFDIKVNIDSCLLNACHGRENENEWTHEEYDDNSKACTCESNNLLMDLYEQLKCSREEVVEITNGDWIREYEQSVAKEIPFTDAISGNAGDTGGTALPTENVLGVRELSDTNKEVPLAPIAPEMMNHITIGMTTCRRLQHFIAVMDKVLALIGSFPNDIIYDVIVVDDNSILHDKLTMSTRYPDVTFVMKSKHSKGHANSLNLLLGLVETRFFVYLEDDWLPLPHIILIPSLRETIISLQNTNKLESVSYSAFAQYLYVAKAILSYSLQFTKEPLVQILLNDQISSMCARGLFPTIVSESYDMGDSYNDIDFSDDDYHNEEVGSENRTAVSDVDLKHGKYCSLATIGLSGWKRKAMISPVIGGDTNNFRGEDSLVVAPYRFHEHGLYGGYNVYESRLHLHSSWPGFSLNPGVWDLVQLKSAFSKCYNGSNFAIFDHKDRAFEHKFSLMALNCGLNTAYLPGVVFEHIGENVSAYILNNYSRPWHLLS